MQRQFTGPAHFSKGRLRGVDPAMPVVDGIDLRPVFRWSAAEFDEIVANPLHDDDLPLLFVHLEDGRPVSRIEAVGDRLRCDGGSVPWLWFCNFETLPSHRGRRIGTDLLRYMIETADRLGCAIGAPPSRPGSLAAYRIAGMPEAVPRPRQVMPLAIDAIAAGLLKRRWLAAPVAATGNAVLSGQRWALRAWQRGGAIRAVDCASVDALPEPLFAAPLPAPIGFERSRATWAWRWRRCQRAQHGDRAYRLLRLDDGTRAGIGAAMLRRAPFDRPGGIPADGLPVVTVLDWIVADPRPAVRRALIQACIAAAVEMRGEVVEFATGDPRLQRDLRRSGFVRAGGYRLFVHADPALARRLVGRRDGDGGDGSDGSDGPRHGRGRGDGHGDGDEPRHGHGDFYWEACHVEDNFTW